MADRQTASPFSSSAPVPTRYIIGSWSHIFIANYPSIELRIVFDTAAQRLVAMHIETRRGFVDASRREIADVQDSLLTANAHVLESPVANGFTLAADMPEWSVRRSSALTQFAREIALCKAQYGQLIDSLVCELEAGSAEAVDEFRWDVVDSAEGKLGIAAANASTDDAIEKETAVANAEAWVGDRIADGSLADIVAASIALVSASETQAAVFAVLATPAPAPAATP